MKKLIKKCSITVLIVVIVLGCNSLFACSIFGNQKYYEEKTLEEAYEAGWITQEHLKSIAYYYNHETKEPDFELIPKEELSKSVEITVKLSYLQRPFIKEDHPDADEDDIGSFSYYGTYNDCVVVSIYYKYIAMDLKPAVDKAIAGIMFYRYRTLRVYNKNSVVG